ncbi:2-keto-4-pentenoate hydratase [Paludisphaera mucosa]|uniref:Fumarylacetoacetate hydrolase family protein n=1 Tax=Paludisphaera mucosa TaxID=3030827 RepID=A0ABT6FEF1_9BACT|nr:fumarylacetoacetate hydrolase family protein [Paludisphaera mucosa]MDG3005958.1 fumarylacetoacetate hydrolase family protein [Paludisphaera mucosa]
MSVDLERLARRMLADFDARTQDRLFAEPIDLTSGRAYDLQAEIARLREARGERVVGYKLGCTSPAVQKQLGIDEPIIARLFDTERHDSGTRLLHASYANLAVEGELAVRLAADLPPTIPAGEECLEAIESIFPVIELHHYVLRSPKPCAHELIASNGMHAGFVLAEGSSGGPRARVRNLTVALNDAIVGRSDAPWTMADPIASLRWLAARLGRHGLRLTRGHVILTGSPLPLYPVGPGDRVVVEVPTLGICRVSVDP